MILKDRVKDMQYREGMTNSEFIMVNESKLLNALADTYPLLYEHLVDTAWEIAQKRG